MIARPFTNSLVFLVSAYIYGAWMDFDVAAALDELLAGKPDMKVLYLSGYTENTVIQHGIVDSSVAFLPKPFTRDALAKTIRDVLEER